MDRSFYVGKRVLIMGLGSFGGGTDAALFFAGAGADVCVTDLADRTQLQGSLDLLREYSIEYHLGSHIEEDFRTAEILIVNPAVPPENRYIQMARQSGALITSQIELFFQMCPAKIVGITGANGKSTTTSLTAHLLQAGRSATSDYNRVWLGGNIGHQPMLEILDQIHKKDIVVLEISNFQLDQLSQIQMAPAVSLITNLTANHIDRHGTFENYCRTKEKIFKFQKLNSNHPAISIFNAEDTITRAWYQKYSDEKGRRCLAFSADDVSEEYVNIFPLPGRANRSNLAAALAVVSCFNVQLDQIASAISTFEGLPNRCRKIAEINGVRWYDDSKATTPVSTMAALKGIDEPKILIAGGYDKQISFAELGRCIAERAKAVVLIGQTADKIADAVALHDGDVRIQRADSMEQAVRIAQELSDPGDVVLLSPACASYDMFKNYIERADAFIRAVELLQ